MKKSFLIMAFLVLVTGTEGRQTFYGKQTSDLLVPLPPGTVKTGGEIGRRIDVTVNNNILKLDVDHDFLASFQKRENKNNYIGLGKLIDSVVKMAVNTGDKRVIDLKNHLTEEVIKAQEPDGYIGNMVPDKRMINLWDIHEMGYIIYGLVTDYLCFGTQKSLDAARKAADYILANWSMLPPGWENQTHVATHVGITGIDRTLLTLYDVTGDKPYLDFCHRQHNLMTWNPPIVIGRKDLIEGHIYGYLASSLAQLELYRKEKNEQLTVPTLKALDFLTAKDGMAITGGAGQVEIWTNDQDGRGDLGETCATAYELRIFDSMLRLKGDSRFGDLIERTVYNALFGAQSPDGRQIRYFTPFEGPRVYHNTDTYCCPCNYRRIVAELPSMVFYRADNGLAVNLYTTSKAEIGMDGYKVAISQETTYPNSGQVLIRVDPSKPASFPLMLRIPLWCKNASVMLNGQILKTDCTAGKFATIVNQWKAGDQVTLELPMDWRLVKGRKQQSGKVAVMRGPLLFCLNPGQNIQLAQKDAADLGKLVIDLASIEKSPVPDLSVRPGGIACRLKAGNSQWAMGNAANLTLTLTEFADPEGKCTYFRTPDISMAVEDELTGLWK